MTVQELVNKLNLKVVSGSEGLGREIDGCYVSDLLSDVMGNADAGNGQQAAHPADDFQQAYDALHILQVQHFIFRKEGIAAAVGMGKGVLLPIHVLGNALSSFVVVFAGKAQMGGAAVVDEPLIHEVGVGDTAGGNGAHQCHKGQNPQHSEADFFQCFHKISFIFKHSYSTG